MEDINIKQIPEDENPKKVPNIAEKVFFLMNNEKVQVSKY